MDIDFRKITQYCTVLNPLKEFREDTVSIEVRFDPLTGERCDFTEFRLAMPHKIDLAPLVAKSLERGCPFCLPNVHSVTPLFPASLFPEGRLQRGQAWLIPNLAPWAEHNPLVVVSEQHHVPLIDFDLPLLVNAFALSQSYYRRIEEMDSKLRYWSIGWNYMPPSGGSQVHPHLQIFGQVLPTPLDEKVFSASTQYQQQNSSSFWHDLIEEEQRIGERYLGNIGQTTWLVNYVSRSWLFEVLTVFRDCPTLGDVSEDDWAAFGSGLMKVFRYLDTKGLYSFNLVLYSGNEVTKDHFCTYARLVPRFLYSPVQAADASLGRILHDWCFVFWNPEEVCTEMKPYFV